MPMDYIKDCESFSKPFSYTGIDTTGPIYVQEGESSVKTNIVIYTCLNIRASHLEVVPSLSCQDFLRSFIRFCNAHTIPEKIFSDNANTFLQEMEIIT